VSACDLRAVTLANGWAEPTDGRTGVQLGRGGGYVRHRPRARTCGRWCWWHLLRLPYASSLWCSAVPSRSCRPPCRPPCRLPASAAPPSVSQRWWQHEVGSVRVAGPWQGRGRAAAPPRRAQRQRAMRRCSEPPPSASRPAHSRGNSSPSAAGDKSHYPYVWRARTYTRRSW
jgi:hypothetical protein